MIELLKIRWKFCSILYVTDHFIYVLELLIPTIILLFLYFVQVVFAENNKNWQCFIHYMQNEKGNKLLNCFQFQVAAECILHGVDKFSVL